MKVPIFVHWIVDILDSWVLQIIKSWAQSWNIFFKRLLTSNFSTKKLNNVLSSQLAQFQYKLRALIRQSAQWIIMLTLNLVQEFNNFQNIFNFRQNKFSIFIKHSLKSSKSSTNLVKLILCLNLNGVGNIFRMFRHFEFLLYSQFIYTLKMKTSFKNTFFKCFSTSKYFIDNNYQNTIIQSANKLNTMHNIFQIFLQSGIQMSHFNSQIAYNWAKVKQYKVNITIERQSLEKIQMLKKKFIQLGINFRLTNPIKVPWFPIKIQDLNLIGKVLLAAKDQANNDHPQFTDKQYRKRRDLIAKVGLEFKIGDTIPNIPYTKEEHDLWRLIYSRLSPLHQKAMSRRYLNQIQQLQKQFKISERIPQLNDLNNYLRNKTGFTIKPTHGILSQRQFFNCLAFRVFCCTQYLRHVSYPDYTPQPDIVHEIVGHVPMFADPDVAEISQQFGLMSLGASDEQISQLGALYWFTLQFGVCREQNKKLAYGAGIAGCIAQLKHLMSDKPRFQNLNPIVDCKATFPIQDLQPVYKLTQNFQKALQDIDEYRKTVKKPITTTYNFQTNTIQYDRNIQAVDIGDKPLQFI